ncbi:hypothetical protein U9M48_040170 [Paspalum notatum var. saurae]|uniref:Uncharacterized protein n=1 Tax=Paspalum notatum var. saurae TaxID=547442 RepID=A0AAQ3UKG7_PASNO
MLRAGATATELHNLTNHLRDLPSAVLDGAIRELARLRDLHLSTGDLDPEGGGLGHHPAPDTDPSSQTRMAHHRDAIAYARDAERKLRSAAYIARACGSTYLAVAAPRPGPPGRRGSCASPRTPLSPPFWRCTPCAGCATRLLSSSTTPAGISTANCVRARARMEAPTSKSKHPQLLHAASAICIDRSLQDNV